MASPQFQISEVEVQSVSVSNYRNRYFDCMVFCLVVGLAIVVIFFMRDPNIT